MFDLPLSWNSIIIASANPRKVIYGYQCDSYNKEYSIYITDFKEVWVEVLSKHEIIQKANSYGIEDTEDLNLDYLLDELSKGFYEDNSKTLLFSFQKTNTCLDDKICIKFNNDFEWDFLATKQSLSVSISLLSQINFQQFENHNYLKFKNEELVKVIQIKDHYIKYLTENYKAINGDELMKKYMKNNRASSKYANKYDEALCTPEIQKAYLDKVKQRKLLTKDSHDELWVQIEKSIKDKSSWVFSKAFEPDVSKKPTFIKLESELTLSDKHDKPEIFIKQEENELGIPIKQENVVSPRKRVKKFGTIGPRKRNKTP